MGKTRPTSYSVDMDTRASPAGPVLSVVVPCHDEADGLPTLHARLSTVMNALALSWELVCVNDGSTDATLAVLRRLRAADARMTVINLSRNFGKEAALTAGLDHARGEAVIVIDADLQDPPELIPELVARWRDGFDVVYAQRRRRDGDGWLKRATARGFYRLMSRVGGVRLPRDVGDFRLMSRRATDAVLTLREHHRFMKGIFAWVGFPSVAVPYDRAAREAGSSSWSYWRLWNLALEGITSFTTAPLRIATYVGLLVALVALLYGVFLIVHTIVMGASVPGYPSLMTVVLFMGGVQLMTLGILGEYVGRVFNETKRRPLYLLERVLPSGFHGDHAGGEPAEAIVPHHAEFDAADRRQEG